MLLVPGQTHDQAHPPGQVTQLNGQSGAISADTVRGRIGFTYRFGALDAIPGPVAGSHCGYDADRRRHQLDVDVAPTTLPRLPAQAGRQS